MCSEVCHVDPTGSLDSRGFKQQQPRKYSPDKQHKSRKCSPVKQPKCSKLVRKLQSNNSDFVEDFEETTPVVVGLSRLKGKPTAGGKLAEKAEKAEKESQKLVNPPKAKKHEKKGNAVETRKEGKARKAVK